MPRWSRDEYNDWLRRNTVEIPVCSIDDTGKVTFLECVARNESLEKKEIQGSALERFLIRFTSVRKRLLDQSNLAYKFHEDLCRYSGIIPNDSPDICESEVTQRKCKKGEKEHTVIEVWKL